MQPKVVIEKIRNDFKEYGLRKKSILLSFFVFIVFFLGAYDFLMRNSFVNPYLIVCNLVSEKIYLPDSQMSPWKKVCIERSKLVTFYSPKKLILRDMNNIFELLRVSHLEIYDSNEVKDIWSGESAETGLIGDYVDGSFVIFKVHPGSPGEKSGVRPGDILEAIQTENPNSWAVAHEFGKLSILRGTQHLIIDLIPGTFLRDDSPQVTAVNKKMKLLRVPSFRSDFFSDKKIEFLYRNIKEAPQLLIDLRGNTGGNFVAGLRFLSLFLCDPAKVGRLVKPRSRLHETTKMVNDLEDDHQVALLDKNQELILESYKSKNCYQGPLNVLIDQKTASVAEMVALALKENKNALIAGTPSSGQLLVGVWYPLNELAPGVQISIPEAFYESQKGFRIEGQAVPVDRVLFYNLPELQKGVDSWIHAMTP